jgi:hypothetical protein
MLNLIHAVDCHPAIILPLVEKVLGRLRRMKTFLLLQNAEFKQYPFVAL